MTVTGYGKDDKGKDYLVLKNQWGKDSKQDIVKVRTEDHPEVIDYAFAPFSEVDQKGIKNPRTLHLTDEMRHIEEYSIRRAVGGDIIFAEGSIPAVVYGGDVISERRL